VLLIYLWAGVLAFGAVALALMDDVPVVLWTTGAGLLIAVIATAVPRERRRRAQARPPVPPQPPQQSPPRPAPGRVR
jgi:UDP-GlcNAc:undecaprenyl-phosphate GlcNAc-1-phosphate transferase